MDFQNPILLGTIGRAQGVRGEVRVKSYTHEPIALGHYGVLFSKNGQRFEILDIRKQKTFVIVRFLGINDRNAAQALNGTGLYIKRESLFDEDLAEDEFFYSDLEGLEAFDEDGKSWGIIKALFDFGSGDLIELYAKGQKSVIIPFTHRAVPIVDIKGGQIIIDRQAAGLLDDDEPSIDKNRDDDMPQNPEDYQ